MTYPNQPSAETTPAPKPDAAKAAKVLGEAIAQVQRVIVGQEHMVEQLMVGLLAKGHCLLEGVPGVAKTLAVRSLRHGGRRRLRPDPVHPGPGALRHRRHPDLHGGQESFDVELGPVFVNFVLADEINRAPAKVQSAMLELMAEKQVSIGGQTYPMPRAVHRDRHPEPDRVRGRLPAARGAARPVPAEGRRALPAGQRGVRDPAPDERASADVASRCSTREVVLPLQEQAADVFVHNLVAEYIVRLVLATRTPAEFGLPDLTSVIQVGCSPRATLGLVAAARALALIHGRDYVLPTDVQSVAQDVMAHRIVLGFDAVADNIQPRPRWSTGSSPWCRRPPRCGTAASPSSRGSALRSGRRRSGSAPCRRRLPPRPGPGRAVPAARLTRRPRDRVPPPSSTVMAAPDRQPTARCRRCSVSRSADHPAAQARPRGGPAPPRADHRAPPGGVPARRPPRPAARPGLGDERGPRRTSPGRTTSAGSTGR